MFNSKNGGNRRAFAISKNRIGSTIYSNGTSFDRQNQLAGIELLGSLVSAKSRRVGTALSKNCSPSDSVPGAERFDAIKAKQIVKQVFEAECRALQEVAKGLESAAIERVAIALINAGRICCYSVGTSRLLASEAEYQFVRLGLRCVSIHDNIQLASQTKLLSSEDVVLVFSHTGRDRSTVAGLALARRAGALIVGITSEPDSPLTKRSDIALVLPETSAVDHATGLHSKVLELTLIEAIAACIAVSTGQEIRVVTR